MTLFFYLVIAFLLGGIPFGLIAGYIAGCGDIRKQGSGNIGATNVWRVAGPTAAVFVLVCDIGKGVFGVLLVSVFARTAWPIPVAMAALAGGIAVVLGHAFSPFLKFRGGKGVSTALGVFLSLMPAETGIAFGVFLVVVLISRYISLGSIIGAITFAVVLWIERYAFGKPVEFVYVIAGTVIAALIMLTHRQNIRRLRQGTENRIRLKKEVNAR